MSFLYLTIYRKRSQCLWLNTVRYFKNSRDWKCVVLSHLRKESTCESKFRNQFFTHKTWKFFKKIDLEILFKREFLYFLNEYILNIPRKYDFLSLYPDNSRGEFAEYIHQATKKANDDNSWIIIPFESGKIRDGERDTAIAGLTAMFEERGRNFLLFLLHSCERRGFN